MSNQNKVKRDTQKAIREAWVRLESGTFAEWTGATEAAMQAVIEKAPKAISKMPQASSELQIEALRECGSPLFGNVAWKFDTEVKFPGSTVWTSLIQTELCRFLNETNGNHDSGLKYLESLTPSWATLSWLSMWPEDEINQVERLLLSTASPDEWREKVSDLVMKGPLRYRPPVEDLSEALYAALE